MKINMNTVGNYAPSYLKAVPNSVSEEAKRNVNISAEEKKFFAELYPAQKEEIMKYQTYNSKGKISGVHVGSLFDRRG